MVDGPHMLIRDAMTAERLLQLAAHQLRARRAWRRLKRARDGQCGERGSHRGIVRPWCCVRR